MVHPLLRDGGDNHQYGGGSMPLAIGLFISVSALVALCTKHGRHSKKKHNDETNKTEATNIGRLQSVVPKSPLPSAKKLMTSISDKTMGFTNKNKDDNGNEAEVGEGELEAGGFGEGRLWQKSILMGERCQPPEFSGVIYYDNKGNQVPQMPRSPKVRSAYPSFSPPGA